MTLHTPWPLDGVPFGFEWLRVALETDLQEGVVRAGDFKVTAPAGGGMRVDIAAGLAVVKGDTGTPESGQGQGLYLTANDASIANAVTLTASHATLPRVDQITLEVNDATDLGDASNSGVLGVVTGTATSLADLNNRTGAAALPSNMIRLADVLVPNASSAVTAGNIRDRRPWARGADYSLAAAGPTAQPGTAALVSGMSARLEITSGLVEVRVSARLTGTNADSSGNVYGYVDGVQKTRGEGFVRGSSFGGHIDVTRVVTVTPGSRLFELWHVSGVAGGTSLNDYELRVRELFASGAN